jgi:diacylglycerol O-acyltransferase / wax synthase
MSTEAMSPLDAAWYHMDGAANPALVTGVALTAQPLDFTRTRHLLRHRLLHFPRFRQRVVEQGLPLPTPHWEDIAHVDMNGHVRRAALPAPGDEAALRALLGELASMPLDRSRPLWDAWVVDNVQGGGALVLRYHHCIGDGRAMMNVAARLFELGAEDRVRMAAHPQASPSPPGLLRQAGLLLDGAITLASALVKSPDPESPFKGDFAPGQRVAWSEPVSIDDVKAIGAASGAKVNDVLVAALAGALRTYLQRRGLDADGTTLRAMVPVDLRPPERGGELGNEFGLVLLDLPVQEPSAQRRLAITQSRMSALKQSSQAPAMRLLLDLFGRGPKLLEDLASGVFGSKASVVLTNVIGPRHAVRFGGVPVERLMFCVPHPGDQLGMGISIMSYAGAATLTLLADAHLVPDPNVIAQAFHHEFNAMRAARAAPRASRRRAPTPAR